MSAMDETSWSAAGGDTLEPGERAELERLRAEVTELRGRRAERRRRIGWRAPIATLLIVLGCVLAPLSVLGVWTANQVSNTSRYVANMAPLAGSSTARACGSRAANTGQEPGSCGSRGSAASIIAAAARRQATRSGAGSRCSVIA